jgi:hypothetical protein
MDLFDPILERPETIDIDAAEGDALFPLANTDIAFEADARANLHNLYWPWADAIYARQVTVGIQDLHDEEFLPMISQRYPGYLETIYGTEGMVVSKRLVAPFKSHYDRSALWLLDCEAEGDRLLRIEVEIDWGEPLTQRMVDGLLVAQRNPQDARGLYGQHNADSTRVFGNPQGRPDQVDLTDPRRARLTYHVLVNGMVEVAMLMTVSDVGEQMAWSGFLALRDSGIVFEKSTSAWRDTLQQGQLWTPDPRVNRMVQEGRILTANQIQRLRTGLAPTQRRIEDVPALVAASDAFDIIQSRNLLAHLRRIAERTEGILPEMMPLRVKDGAPAPPLARLPVTNGAYLHALAGHLDHHPDDSLLAQHYGAVGLSAEQVIRARVRRTGETTAPGDWAIHDALMAAARLARRQGDEVNEARWEGEARAVTPPADAEAQSFLSILPQAWEVRDNGHWSRLQPQTKIAFAGAAVWLGCGLQWRDGVLHVAPRMPDGWEWWALMALPYGPDQQLSLVWDGATLHVTQPVIAAMPVTRHRQIQLLHTDEYEFKPTFHFISESAGEAFFRPEFMTA